MNGRRALGIGLAVALTFGLWPSATPVNAALTRLLPDLAVVAPYEFRIVIHTSGQKRLRFTSLVVNLGPGPFQLYGYDEDGQAVIGDGLLVRQQIRQSDGTFFERETGATMFWAGDGHNHFHVRDLQLIKIEKLDGTELKRAKKVGFCFLDSYRYTSTAPTVYNSTASVCHPAPNGRVPMGISVGWGDVYRSTIAHQWIDISGLPNGDYRVRVIADPPYTTGGRFLEANETNNRGWTKIRIIGNSVTVLARSARP
jgi:hypothetical protein